MNKQALIDEIAAIADRVEGDEYDEGVRSAVLHSLALVNKHLPDNEVSVPVEQLMESLKEVTDEAILYKTRYLDCCEEDYMCDSVVVKKAKAMLQAHKGEGDE